MWAARQGLTLEQWEEQRSKRADSEQRKRNAESQCARYRGHLSLLRSVQEPHRRELQRRDASRYQLARYYEDKDNWTTRKKRRRLFERDGWKCRVCGVKVSDSLHMAHPRRAVAMHIVAKARGGEWTEENMATGCYSCNVADGVHALPIQKAFDLR